MTTPNIPDLPHTLAVSTGGMAAPITVTETNPAGRIRLAALRDGNLFDPADLIRELSRFVPIPAEARKVITAWLARPLPFPAQGNERADDLLATLAAAGLLVGPGEPAASEGEPVAWMDTDGDFYVSNAYRLSGHDALRGVFSNDELDLRTFTALYAHPPVTAEPATAPSAEQIAEVVKDWYLNNGRDKASIQVLSVAIRALWSPAPGDAGGSRVKALEDALNRSAKHAATLRERAEKAEAYAAEVENERDDARHDAEMMKHDRDSLRTSLLERAKAAESQVYDNGDEIVRLRAALDAAEDRYQSLVDLRQWESRHDDSRTNLERVRALHKANTDRFLAARAAVEADTEGARDE